MPLFRGATLAEKVGNLVLFPFRLVGLILLLAFGLPLAIIAYPVVVIIILLTSKAPLLQRIKDALLWPLTLLAINELLGLGGNDVPLLSRITNWLNGRFGDGEGKWVG